MSKSYVRMYDYENSDVAETHKFVGCRKNVLEWYIVFYVKLQTDIR